MSNLFKSQRVILCTACIVCIVSIRYTKMALFCPYCALLAHRITRVAPALHPQERRLASIYHINGLHGNYGTYSSRKTKGYHTRMQGIELPLIKYKFNISSLFYAKRYLGITDDELHAVLQCLIL